MNRKKANNLWLMTLFVSMCVGSSSNVSGPQPATSVPVATVPVTFAPADAHASVVAPVASVIQEHAVPTTLPAADASVAPVDHPTVQAPAAPITPPVADASVVPASPAPAQQAVQSTSTAVQSAPEPEKHEEPAAVLPVSDEPSKEALESDFTDEDVINTTQARDTSGNWVFKNYWWRKIEEEISVIKDIFEKAMATQSQFFVRRAALDKDLDIFYLKIGFEQGPLENIIKFCLDTIEKEKNKQGGMLTKKEGMLFEKIKEKQRDFEQLKEDTKSIQELDHKVDAALELLLSQIDLCYKYQQAAWDIFKKVSHELNDKVARKQYYVVKGLIENAQHVLEYISGPFTVYFGQLEEAAKTHMGDIESKVGELSKLGFDLRKETETLEKDDDEADMKAMQKAKQSVDQKTVSGAGAKKETKATAVGTTVDNKEPAKNQKQGMWDRFVSWCVSVSSSVKAGCIAAFHWCCSCFSSKETTVKTKPTVVEQKPVSVAQPTPVK